MKLKTILLSLLLVLAVCTIPFAALCVSAEDTTNIFASTETPSGLTGQKDTTAAVTTDSADNTETGDDSSQNPMESMKDKLESDVDSVMPDKEGGNISTDNSGAIDNTDKGDDTSMNTWLIVVAIVIVLAIVILIFCMIPKKR